MALSGTRLALSSGVSRATPERVAASSTSSVAETHSFVLRGSISNRGLNMHELSLASSIADIVHRHARGRRVTRVEVAVGHLRQAVPSALCFGFELVTLGTPLEGAELRVREV